MSKLLYRPTTAIWLPSLVGLILGAIAIAGFGSYGFALFLGLPLVLCFLTGLICGLQDPPY